MDCSSSCSTPCSTPAAVDYGLDINAAVDRLADLLTASAEYQQFMRAARLVNSDPDVRRMVSEMRKAEMLAGYPEGRSAEDLHAEFEALPSVAAYRQADAALHDLFRTVDGVISAGAGVAFAPNAVRSACG